MSTMTIQDKAKEAASWFELANRYEGEPGKDVETFTRTKDGAPEWVTAIVYAGHHGWSDFLPDDWRYDKIRDALEYIADADDPEDVQGEFADNAVDVYTSDRLAWLSSNLNRPTYCDDAAAEYGSDTATDIIAMIGMGQYAEAYEIYGLVLQALENE